MSGILYHNPRCSKSRQTLELLKERGVNPSVSEYLKTPMDHPTLKNILALLNIPAHALIRSSEAIYKELELSSTDTEEQLIDAMIAHPKLIQRPIYVNKGKAALGRPPENILAII
ncbi:MAG: arsenate reductase (glutaredoxin) [Gammaproteobacteria bacterium]|nr:arsenate reductase (glutaredoxin) [Gammaproteobacteria bacterium]